MYYGKQKKEDELQRFGTGIEVSLDGPATRPQRVRAMTLGLPVTGTMTERRLESVLRTGESTRRRGLVKGGRVKHSAFGQGELVEVNNGSRTLVAKFKDRRTGRAFERQLNFKDVDVIR
jgi:hypothetical protein